MSYDERLGIAQRMDAKGRCCGRKPLVYKRMHPPPHHYCPRCDRAYALDSCQQIENWAWKSDGRGGFCRVRATTASLDTPLATSSEPSDKKPALIPTGDAQQQHTDNLAGGSSGSVPDAKATPNG